MPRKVKTVAEQNTEIEERLNAPRATRTAGQANLAAMASANSDEEVQREPCLCGCGVMPNSKKAKFFAGHDMKLKSIGLKTAAGKVEGDPFPFTEDQRYWLEEKGIIVETAATPARRR